MSWSDDEFDVSAQASALEQKKRAVAADDSGDDTEKEELERRKEAEEAAKAKAKPKPKKKKPESKVEEKAPEPEDDGLTPAQRKTAEKLRRQKLVEEQDARMASDLFSGCSAPAADTAKADKEAAEKAAAVAKVTTPKIVTVTKDAFDNVELSTQADVEELGSTCVSKIEKGKAKGAAQIFLVNLFKALEGDLTLTELQNLEKTLAASMKEKKVEKTSVDANKRKTNEKLSKTTKFNTSDELATVYGGGAEDWGDWDEYDDDYYEGAVPTHKK